MALTAAQNLQIAERVRETLARRRISRQTLADQARISVSTLEKALAGDRPFSLASVLRLEQALGVALHATTASAPQIAPPELGSYVRSSVSWLEGEYLTLRPSFEQAGSINAYCTAIAWDEKRYCLQFSERERFDSANAQVGNVSLPPAKRKIYLTTSEDGELRLAILNSPTRSREIYGLLLTLTAGTPGLPAATPIALVPRKAEHQFGRFARDDAAYQRYRIILAQARKAVHLHDVPV